MPSVRVIMWLLGHPHWCLVFSLCPILEWVSFNIFSVESFQFLYIGIKFSWDLNLNPVFEVSFPDYCFFNDFVKKKKKYTLKTELTFWKFSHTWYSLAKMHFIKKIPLTDEKEWEKELTWSENRKKQEETKTDRQTEIQHSLWFL